MGQLSGGDRGQNYSGANSTYDDHGRVTQSTDETGTTTATTFDDKYGLITA